MSSLTGSDIIRYYTQQGMPVHIAAAFAGNFEHESGLNPASIGDSGHAFGLGQWSGNRAQQLFSLADSRGVPWTDPNLQLDFALNELRGSEQNAAQKIWQTKTPEEATIAISNNYERPGIPVMESRLNKTLAALRSFGQAVGNAVSGGIIPSAEAAPTATPTLTLPANPPVPAGLTPVNQVYGVGAGAPAPTTPAASATDNPATPTLTLPANPPVPAGLTPVNQVYGVGAVNRAAGEPPVPTNNSNPGNPPESPSGWQALQQGAVSGVANVGRGLQQLAINLLPASEFQGSAEFTLTPEQEAETQRRRAQAAAADQLAMGRIAQAGQQQKQEDQPYYQAHPWLFRTGGIGADLAMTAPLLLAAPTSLPAFGLKRMMIMSLLGGGQGAAVSALHPVDVSQDQDFWTQKGKQIAGGAASGALLAPAIDTGILGMIGGIRGLIKLGGEAGQWLTGTVQPLSQEAQDAASAANIPLSIGDISGNPMLLRTENAMQYIPGTGIAGRYAEGNAAARTAADAQRGMSAGESGNRVAAEINAAQSSRLTGQQQSAQQFADQFRPADVATPGRGIKEGLQAELAARRQAVAKAYDAVDETARQEGVTNLAIPTPNTMQAIRQLKQTLSPDTWKTIGGTALESKLDAIASGLNDTQTLQRMPLENLAKVAQDAADQATARFPNQASGIRIGTTRESMINAIQEFNGLISARPVDVLGTRPAGSQGMLDTIMWLGGLKDSEMKNVIGESTATASAARGIFTQAGRSPEEMARALQEEGYAVDPSPKGIKKMYDVINNQLAGRTEPAGNLQAQQEYDLALERARESDFNRPTQWMPGRALDFAGMQRLNQDLNDFYGKASRASGGIGSQEEMAFAAVKTALARDAEAWANSTGSTKVLQAFRDANRLYEESIAPYHRANTPEVNRVISNEEADKAYRSLFNPNAPELAGKSFSLLDQKGQNSAKWGLMSEILNSATKGGTAPFDQSLFMQEATRQSPLIKQMLSPAEQKSFGDLAQSIGSTSVDTALERSAQTALNSGDATAFMSQFAGARKSDPTVARLMMKLSPDGKNAVADYVMDSAYRAGNDTTSGVFSLARYSTFLKNHEEVLRQAGRWDEVKGLAQVMDRVQRYGQYMDDPINGSRMATLAGLGAIGGGGLIGGWTGAATIGMPALITPVAARALTSLLTSTTGKAILTAIGSKSEQAAAMTLESPAWQRALAAELSRLGVISVNQPNQPTQPTPPRQTQ